MTLNLNFPKTLPKLPGHEFSDPYIYFKKYIFFFQDTRNLIIKHNSFPINRVQFRKKLTSSRKNSIQIYMIQCALKLHWTLPMEKERNQKTIISQEYNHHGLNTIGYKLKKNKNNIFLELFYDFIAIFKNLWSRILTRIIELENVSFTSTYQIIPYMLLR